ncbi:MAG: S-layer protein, partial [uncultured bacterium (gcode 4)]
VFTDEVWNSSTATWFIVFDTTAPVAPTITSTNLTTSGSTVIITGTWEADTIVQILNWSGNIIASWSVDVLWNFSISWVPVVDWWNILQARLIDEIWNVWDNSSQTVTVIVDTIEPDAPVITSSLSLTSSWTVIITWVWEPDSTVFIFKWENLVWNWSVNWSWDIDVGWIPLTEWLNLFTARLIDLTWNTSAVSNSLTITKDSFGPVVSNKRIDLITQIWATLRFDFIDSHYTVWTWTWIVTVWTWWSLDNIWSFELNVGTWSVNSAISVFSGLFPNTIYGFNISLLDDAWNVASSSGSFITATEPITNTWTITETWSTTFTWSISVWWSLEIVNPLIVINSNPNNLNSVTWSLTISWITNISVSSGTWNWVMNPPSLVNSWALEEATISELTSEINANFWSWVTGTVLETIKAWSENDVTLTAVWWTFEISFQVSSASWSVLNLFRSSNWNLWEMNSPDTTCTVDSNNFCTFRTDHLSYFASVSIVDNIPDSLNFTSLTWRALSSIETSNILTVTGINTWSTVSVSNGLISINSWAFNSTWVVEAWDTIQLRLTNSSVNSTLTTTTISVGSTPVWSFSSTTLASSWGSGWWSGGGSNGWWGGGGSWITLPDSCIGWDKSWNLYDKKCDAPIIQTNPTNSWNIMQTAIPSIVNMKFIDIDDSFAKADIEEMVAKWIIKWFDDGTFRPNNSATRAEFLAIVMKSLWTQLDESLVTTSFTDIPASWMIKYVEKAKEYWIKGQFIDWQLKFRPNDAVTRAEAIAMLTNIWNISVDNNVTSTDFTDVNIAWMMKYVAKAKEYWIISGQIIDWQLRFRPNDAITRAEAVRVISKTVSIKNWLSKNHTVEISSEWYSPNTLTIKAWDTVKYVNKDSVLHWVASAMHPLHQAYPGSDIAKCGTNDQSWIFDACKWLKTNEEFSFKFNSLWTWKYHDHLNANDSKYYWTIIVE